MPTYYKSQEGQKLVEDRYRAFLKYWPVPNEHLRIPTRVGETFVIASGDPNAPALVLFHGGLTNSVTWMPHVASWSKHFRVYAVDMIGEPGFSAPSRPKLATDAHALWLDDVMKGLAVDRASLVGVSLGGWLALDYATRRPEFVERLAVLCPGGVGPQKIGILFKLIVMHLMGEKARKKSAEMVLGKASSSPSPAVKAFGDFLALMRTHFTARKVKMPIFSDPALKGLSMPVLAIVGGKDTLLDSVKTKERLQRNVARVDVRFLPEVGHFIPGQTAVIEQFLLGREPS